MIALGRLRGVSVSTLMARNDQVTRQWHLLRLLESSRGVTLDEIVSRLPADYPRHGRTVRRDLEALEAAGFPILNERIEGRIRWRLMDGIRHCSSDWIFTHRAHGARPQPIAAQAAGRHRDPGGARIGDGQSLSAAAL